MADALAITPHASGAEASDGSGAAVDIGTLRTCLALRLDVTAVAGTFASGQGLTVSVQTSTDGSTGWATVATFAVKTAVGVQSKTIPGCRQFVRASWTVTGSDSPGFTFALTGKAHVLYAEPADLDLTINPLALQNVDDETRAKHLLRATTDMETALNSSNSLPLTAWGEDIRGVTSDRAMYYAMVARGFSPDSPADQLILLKGGVLMPDGRRAAAQKFIDDVAAGRIKPAGTVDQTPDVYEAAGYVVSDTART
jgi:hypothetical protein